VHMLKRFGITRVLVASMALPAAMAAGCGGSSEEAPARAKATPAAVERVDPGKDPHAITCGDLADKEASAEVSRRAQFALADEAKVRDMSRLRIAQSIFFAMTELCKSAEESYTPAADAVKAVERGEYVADLNAP
jgi:hypothetical protein